MAPAFFKKVKSHIRRQSKPNEIGSAGTEDQPTLATPLPAPSAPPASAVPEGLDEIPGEQKSHHALSSLSLWQDAFSELDSERQNILAVGLKEDNTDHDKEMTSSNIELALQEVIETVQQQHEIRTLKNDKKIYKATKGILGAATSLQQGISAAVSCDPTGHASTAWTVVSLGLKITQNYCDQQDEWFESSAFLADILSRTTLYEVHYVNKSPEMKGNIEKALLQVYTAILEYSADVIKIGRSRKGKRILKSIIALNDLPLTGIKSAIQNQELRLESLARMQEYLCLDSKADKMLAQGDRVLEKVQNVDDDLVLLKLPVAKRAAFNSHANEPREYCLPDTSVKVLEKIEDWVNDSEAKSIFWLSGMAGTGKSTILRTVARDLKQRGLLGASFFFNRSEQDCAKSESLLTTITKQLVDVLPQLQDGVTEAIRQDSTLVTSSPGDQIDRLLKKPLSAIRTRSDLKLLLVVVIDALDECQDDKNIQSIIKRLPELQHASSAVEIRFCVTSRPESYILSGFKEVQDEHTPALLHRISEPTIEHDIRTFFQQKLPKMRKARGLDEHWPGEKNIQLLIQMAVPLFIYAATICRTFEDETWAPQTSLDGFLNHQDEQSSQLSGTYLPVLKRLLLGQGERQKRQLVNEFQSIVGAVLLLQDPLPMAPLAELLDIRRDTVQTRLNTLRSVIQVPEETEEPVRIFHQSFRDYLLDPEPSERTQFSIDRATMNQRIGFHCIRVMEREKGGLKRNILNLPSFGATRTGDPLPAHDNLPKELQYACRNWATHLCQDNVTLGDQDRIYQFLKKHCLHWLEAMGIMGVSAEAVELVNGLLSLGDLHPELSRFLCDAKRFITWSSQMIDIAPLQLYCAGLTFSPTESLIRQTFDRERFKKIKILPQVGSLWGANLQTLKGHSEPILSLVFSPSGQTVVSSSDDKAIKLWDSATGKLRQTLEGNHALSVVFSLDGQTMVSSMFDGTVKLWDTATGRLRQTLTGHYHLVQAVVLSSDGQVVASGSNDTTVKLWNSTTGREQMTLRGHSENVIFVAFLGNDEVVVSCSKDGTIIFWDAITGDRQHTTEIDSKSPMSSMALSPDNRTMASVGMFESTIQLWDIATGKQQRILEGHSGWVSSVVFSPDGQALVSCSGDEIKFWDVTTGKVRQTLRGHSSFVERVEFSPDGRTVASGARDGMIKLWDVMTDVQIADEQRMIPKYRSEMVRSIAFSPDGQIVATGSNDSTIKIWDASTGRQLRILQGHSDWVISVCFSPDGQTIASGSSDMTVMIWDATTGEQINIFENSDNFGYIWCLAFSPDGRSLAAGFEHAIKLWDLIRGEERKIMCDPDDAPPRGFDSIAFSPDGQTVVSGSRDCTMRLWNAHTGEQERVMYHSDWVVSVAFSPDGQTIASGSYVTVELWDAITGKNRHTLRHSDLVRSVSFSPDGLAVISELIDFTLRLWDPTTGKEQQTNLVQLAGWAASVPVDQPDPQLSLIDNWIVFQGERLLWLPVEYRSFTCSARKGSLLALGYEDGRVVILGFGSSAE